MSENAEENVEQTNGGAVDVFEVEKHDPEAETITFALYRDRMAIRFRSGSYVASVDFIENPGGELIADIGVSTLRATAEEANQVEVLSEAVEKFGLVPRDRLFKVVSPEFEVAVNQCVTTIAGLLNGYQRFDRHSPEHLAELVGQRIAESARPIESPNSAFTSQNDGGESEQADEPRGD